MPGRRRFLSDFFGRLDFGFLTDDLAARLAAFDFLDLTIATTWNIRVSDSYDESDRRICYGRPEHIEHCAELFWGSTLTKDELVNRVNRRSMKRYGISFEKAFLNDLIKDRLIPKTKRLQNAGKRPVYEYRRDAYRRALQISRMRAYGVVSRDGQRIFLFLRGYGLTVQRVRRSMLNEYTALGKQVLSRIRSTYIDKKGPIPDKRRRSLVKSLGEPDIAFKNAGAIPLDQLTIEVIREAKQEPLQTFVQMPGATIVGGGLKSKEGIAVAKKLASGLLMFDGIANDSDDIHDVKQLILKSSDGLMLHARELLRQLDLRHPLIVDLLFPAGTAGTVDAMAEKIGKAFRQDSGWASLTFVTVLRFAAAVENAQKVQPRRAPRIP
jgi:hypothetical protein